MPAPRILQDMVSALLASLASPAAADTVQLPGDIAGFAGEVTGGTNRVVFDDLDSLRRCLGKSGNLCEPRSAMTIAPKARRLLMAGAVTLDGKGLLSFQCDSYCLDLRQGGNNVVRRVRFAGPGPQRTLWPARFPNANCTNPTMPKHLTGCAAPLFLKSVRNVLIERNEFVTCGNKCVAIEGGDANTLRRNRFTDSYFAILAVSKVADGPFSRVTVAGNVFTRIFRRSARVSGHFLMHEIGNVLAGHCPDLPGGGFGVSAVGEAQALVEGNFADADACAALNVIDAVAVSDAGQMADPEEGPQKIRGRILARWNTGIEDRAADVNFPIPYAVPALRTDEAARREIDRAAGAQ